jgi:NAD(P)-dependent dehydrogenase (short-subunit alcohol dehydrogenase family)
VNLLGPFELVRRLVAPMLIRGRGLVVNISSDAAVSAYPRWGGYGASKAALDQLGRVLAAELEGSGVRVLSVDPGEMDTAMHAEAIPDADRSVLADPAEVARRIVAMAKDADRAPNGARIEAQRWEVRA